MFGLLLSSVLDPQGTDSPLGFRPWAGREATSRRGRDRPEQSKNRVVIYHYLFIDLGSLGRRDKTWHSCPANRVCGARGGGGGSRH